MERPHAVHCGTTQTSAIHAYALVVKPDDTWPNRMFSAENGPTPGTLRNIPAENTRFFPNRRPCDGPRCRHDNRRRLSRKRSADAREHAAANDATAPVEPASRCPSIDTLERPATETNGKQTVGTLHCNTGSMRGWGGTPIRNPSVNTDVCADGERQYLESCVIGYHAPGPRECLLPDGQVSERSFELRSEAFYKMSRKRQR